MTFLGEGKVAVVDIHSPVLGNLNVYAGELDWKWDNPVPAGYPQDFYTYCVDIDNFVTNDQQTTISTMDQWNNSSVPDAGEEAAWLFDTFAAPIHATGTGTQAAGLQVAIWAVLYDTDPTDLLDGSQPFYLVNTLPTNAVYEDAISDLNALAQGYTTADAAWLNAPAGAGQDQMTALPTPEPASLILLASGLAAAIGARRRRAGKSA